MQAQRSFSGSTSELEGIYRRLSSGLRITKASDDAGGLAVASGLQVDTKVYGQGLRNINDGISLLNIADQSIGELTNIVSRIQELAAQSSNGTVSNSQRDAIDQEAQALSKEFSRIIKQTEFNDKKLLNYDFGDLSLQTGYGTSANITSDLGGVVGDRTYESADLLYTGTAPYYMIEGDFNGDGNLDLASGDQTANTIDILLGQGDGTFTSGGSFATAGSRVLHVNTADFNNDGILDLQATNTTSGSVSILLGVGDGTFGAATTYSVGTSPFSSVIGDFNNDGNLDIISASDTANHSILTGNGDGTFNAATTFASGGSAQSFDLAAGDFNGDGNLDISFVEAGSSVDVYTMLGNGDGTFGSTSIVTTTTQAFFLDIGDLNGDGIEDMVTGNAGGTGSVGVYLGVGDGTFTHSKDLASTSKINEIKIRDLDGDGNMDVVAGTFPGSSIFAYFGDGNGSFSTATTIGSIVDSIGLVVADFTNDGVNDVAVASNTDKTISLIQSNTTSGTAALTSFDLSTQYGATTAIPMLERKLDSLTLQRSEIGAYMNRLGYAASNLSQIKESTLTAANQILDADIAYETASLVKYNIIQQAAASVMTQANLQASLVLDLISFDRDRDNK